MEHEVDHISDFVELKFDGNQVNIETIMDELEEIGYRPAAYRDASGES
jgi:copper chaperone CopZ